MTILAGFPRRATQGTVGTVPQIQEVWTCSGLDLLTRVWLEPGSLASYACVRPCPFSGASWGPPAWA